MQFLAKETVPIYGWTEGVPIEDKALGQLKNVESTSTLLGQLKELGVLMVSAGCR